MYIEQAFKGKYKWWMYLMGLLLSFVGISLFSIPHGIAILLKDIDNPEKLINNDLNYILSLFDPNLNLIFMILPFVGGLIGLFFIVRFLHQLKWSQFTSTREKIDWKRVAFSFVFWGIVSTCISLISIYYSPETTVYNFEWNRFIILVIIAILLIPIQTSFEEYIFRGYLLQAFGIFSLNKNFSIIIFYSILTIALYFILEINDKLITYLYVFLSTALLLLLLIFNVFKLFLDSGWYKIFQSIFRNKLFPILLSSVLFGLMHLANPEIEQMGYILLVYYIGTGLFLAIITIMDNGLELALGFHAANNLFTALLITANWTAFQTHSIFKDISEPEKASFADVFMPVFIIFPILIFIFSKIYKWEGWQEKLLGQIQLPPKASECE